MRKMSDIVRHQDPLTLPLSATVREACQSMRDGRVGAVLVTEGDHCLVGIFTGRDAVLRWPSKPVSRTRGGAFPAPARDRGLEPTVAPGTRRAVLHATRPRSRCQWDIW